MTLSLSLVHSTGLYKLVRATKKTSWLSITLTTLKNTTLNLIAYGNNSQPTLSRVRKKNKKKQQRQSKQHSELRRVTKTKVETKVVESITENIRPKNGSAD